jgi:hypothetical protein
MTSSTAAEPYYLIIHSSSIWKQETVQFRLISVYPEGQPSPAYPQTLLKEYPVAEVLVSRKTFKVFIERRMYDPTKVVGGASDPNEAAEELERLFDEFKTERGGKGDEASYTQRTNDGQGGYVKHLVAKIGEDWHLWESRMIDLQGGKGYLYYTTEESCG